MVEEHAQQVADGTESMSKNEDWIQRMGRLGFVTKYHFQVVSLQVSSSPEVRAHAAPGTNVRDAGAGVLLQWSICHEAITTPSPYPTP